MDYADKLKPTDWYIFAPPRWYIFSPPLTSDATLYKWKSRYGGMQVSELRRLKGLEAENAELKRLLADAMLDNAGLKGLLAKNS